MFEERSVGPSWKLSADVGLWEHESNGRGPDPDRPVGAGNTDELSRSMNRAFIRPTFTVPTDLGIFSIAPKFFVPFLVSHNNRDIAHYRGNSDLLMKWRSRESQGHVFSLFLRQGTDSSKHYVQADYGMPLRLLAAKNLNGWLLFQWLYGYGETLRDYNVRNPGTLRIGIMAVP
jgi:outer membrane phospholipase A